jgi:transcription antitermination factor NusG
MEEKNEKHWFVIYTRYNAEKKLHKVLNDAGYEVFLPLYTTIRQWSDRKKKVEIPLINSVVFVRSSRTELNELYTFTQVNGILKEQGQPGVVRDQEIRNLQIISSEWNGDIIETNEDQSLASGDTIEVVRGPFSGVLGELVNHNGKHRVVVRLRSMQVEFVINIPKNTVRKSKAAKDALKE